MVRRGPAPRKPARRPAARNEPPAAFRVARELPLGRHRLLEVFPGLETLPTATRQEPDAGARAVLYGSTHIELVADDVWMYVAPRRRPDLARRRGWSPVVSADAECIVVGEAHLRESPALVLFMDIFHELCHIQQRNRGEELFDRPESYVRRPTELSAYHFVVEEARRLGADDAFLGEYLRVDWITEAEYEELLGAMGVPVPAVKRA